MTAILKVDTIQDTSGNNIINENANTITIGKSGDTTNIVGTLQNDGAALISGITMVDQFALTSNFSLSNGANIITANLARVSNGESPGFIGTGMTESSGIFTFPSTGIYIITFNAFANSSAAALYNTRQIQVTLNNSSYATAASSDGNFYAGTSYGGSSVQYILDVTDTANVKVRFRIDGQGTNTTLLGNSGTNDTSFTFIRLGDT